MLSTLVRALPGHPAPAPPPAGEQPTDRALHGAAPGWTIPGGLHEGHYVMCLDGTHRCGGEG